MTGFDELAQADGDEECRLWIRKIIHHKNEIIDFVASRRGEGKFGEFVRYLKGSFNLCLCIKFNDGGPNAIIRFPKPGHTKTEFGEEKAVNEVRVLKYLSQKTTIPLPRVTSWGLTKDSPQQLGPFIIMDYVDGTRLSALLKQPTKSDQDDEILNPVVDNKTLDIVYDQLADYMIQLSQLHFTSIGAISEDPILKTWSVTGRPLTYNMNENTSNLARNMDDAQRRFIARHQFIQLTPQYCMDDSGPFIPFCDDIQPSNMLVDPETLQITALLDFEFTNAMPAQFSYDPPSWLLLLGPDMWLEGHTMEEFLARYEPRLAQFLRALERVEAKFESTGKLPSGPRLSTRMHDSWKTKRFWFDYGIRKSFDIDAVYWAALHDGSAGIESLDDEKRAEMESMTNMKMEQLKASDRECAARFSESGSK